MSTPHNPSNEISNSSLFSPPLEPNVEDNYNTEGFSSEPTILFQNSTSSSDVQPQFIHSNSPYLNYNTMVNIGGMGPAQWKSFLLAGFVWILDALEVSLISFLLPFLEREFHVKSVVEQSASASFMFVGMGIGSAFWGFLSDKSGRRVALLLSLCFTTGFGLTSAFSNSYIDFLIFRTLTGVGIGGNIPIAFSNFVEFCPTQRRGFWSILTTAWWGVGAIIGAMIAYFTLNSLGWRAYVILSALPGFFIILMSYFLPESPRYLLLKGNHIPILRMIIESAQYTNNLSMLDEYLLAKFSNIPECPESFFPLNRDVVIDEVVFTICDIVSKSLIKSKFVADSEETSKSVSLYAQPKPIASSHAYRSPSLLNDEQSSSVPFINKCLQGNSDSLDNNDQILFETPKIETDDRGKISDLFVPRFRRLTLTIWFIMFCFGFSYYGFVIVLPEIFSELNSDSIGIYIPVFISSLAIAPFVYLAAKLNDSPYFGRRKTFGLFLGFTIVFILLLSLATTTKMPVSFVWILIFSSITTSAMNGASAIIQIFTTEIYPTTLRSLGLGIGSVFSRVASICAPLAGHFLFREYGPGAALFLFSIFFLLAGIGFIAIPYETGGRNVSDTVEEENLDDLLDTD